MLLYSFSPQSLALSGVHMKISNKLHNSLEQSQNVCLTMQQVLRICGITKVIIMFTSVTSTETSSAITI